MFSLKNLPIARERRWVVVAWAVIAVLSIPAAAMFIYLWIRGEPGIGPWFPAVAVWAAVSWISVGANERLWRLCARMLTYSASEDLLDP